jgi:hypothetical protein
MTKVALFRMSDFTQVLEQISQMRSFAFISTVPAARSYRSCDNAMQLISGEEELAL